LFGGILTVSTGQDLAHNHLVDRLFVDTGSFYRFLYDKGPQIGGPDGAKGTVETAQGSPASGAEYAYQDSDMRDAANYWYKLEGVGCGDLGSTSIALDSSDRVHISYYDYYDGTNHDLKYATNASGFWALETVDAAGDVGDYTSIGLDSSGKAHISYLDRTNESLMYATNASGSWTIETVDPSGNVGQYTSIALDSSDNLHVSYYSGFGGAVKHATQPWNPWTRSTVDSTGDVGLYTSIGLDSSGKAHISYWDWTNRDLKYATNASGGWVTETVDSTGDVGLYTSIGLDSSGKVHISCWNRTEDDLKYATNASGSWVTITVDSGEAGTLYPHLPVSATPSLGWAVPPSSEASAMGISAGNGSSSNPIYSIALLLIPIGVVLILRARLRK